MQGRFIILFALNCVIIEWSTFDVYLLVWQCSNSNTLWSKFPQIYMYNYRSKIICLSLIKSKERRKLLIIDIVKKKIDQQLYAKFNIEFIHNQLLIRDVRTNTRFQCLYAPFSMPWHDISTAHRINVVVYI